VHLLVLGGRAGEGQQVGGDVTAGEISS